MSDQELPPAAFDVTSLRQAINALSRGRRRRRLTLIGFAIAVVILIITLVSLRFGGILVNAVAVFAIGIVGVAVLLAVIVVLPAQLSARSRIEGAEKVRQLRSSAATALRDHLASIGYAVSLSVADDWVAAVEPTVTVPLVHESVIAARRWQPSADDTRIFVEPYLLQGEVASSLPRLPPVAVEEEAPSRL